MPEPILTTSWDDGHPADRRLAERLAGHGVAATFFVPIGNAEGRPVMGAAELRALAADGFELAAHTLDHRRLQHLSEAEARRQIIDGRRRLEDTLGAPVVGFAYPGGHAGPHGRRLAAETGFAYARTTRMFCLSPGPDPLMMATTAQIYPHRAGAVLRNWARRGGGLERLRLAARWLAADGLEGAMDALLDEAAAQGGVLHLWGHSWEIEEQGLWPVLDRVLAAAAARVQSERRLTVRALASAIS